MNAMTFDSLAYFEKLKAAGVPEAQAMVQAEGMRAQSEAIHAAIKNYDESRQKELATKGDLQETRMEIEIKIREAELRLLKWQIGLAVTILLVMAKGFKWLGF